MIRLDTFLSQFLLIAALMTGVGLGSATAQASHETNLSRSEIGVVFMPHGADSLWNATMRQALLPLSDHYVTVNAFGMANPDIVEAALRKLEAQGMRGAVVVRIFSLENSFRTATEYMLGLSDYDDSAPMPRGMHTMRRIETPLRVVTTGGMEAHPLLAEAMADRARELSRNPERETVILLGHGAGQDEEDMHWKHNLESIADYIRSKPGLPFRDIRVGTWREDWPDKRDAAVAAIREMVEEAGVDGGVALVIPVRTIMQGPENDYLDGLNYRLGAGFAPHPAFLRWVASEIEEGMAELLYR